jgi:uncharacterized protein (TIGR00303 family)
MAQFFDSIRVHTSMAQGQQWLHRYADKQPAFACVLGFTDTGLIEGISAAGATPEDRKYTALADAEFLYHGPNPVPQFPLPPLAAGASPVLISRAVVEQLSLPLYLFDAGLPQPLPVPHISLNGKAARCLTTAQAMEMSTVRHLFHQGWQWGSKLAAQHSYLLLGECVVGGTTTALAILSALGKAAYGKINSSHPTCNHSQKEMVVRRGLAAAQEKWGMALDAGSPWEIVASVGDPMQIAVAGMALAASRTSGVLLAGGTQMLAVYALASAIANVENIEWEPEQVVVGTTRWVVADASADTVGLAQMLGGVPLLASQLSFAGSAYPQLRAYELGYVKEGMGAGGCAAAAHLYRGWNQSDLLHAIESLAARFSRQH